MLRELRDWCTENDVLLIIDEVMTGFGRTGTMFACEQEEVAPDFLNIAKGLTGGYLPMAATLTTEAVFETFLGDASRTFYYGHSYTANPLACAAALASLEIFDDERVLEGLPEKVETLRDALARIGNDRRVVETRQRGLASAIEVRGEGSASKDLEAQNRLGAFVCNEARRFGLLTRPIGNSVIFLPPLCISCEQIEASIEAVRQALGDL
jgi:adenosylmethionine-8-amino-7-oxononanoate aminotransferase